MEDIKRFYFMQDTPIISLPFNKVHTLLLSWKPIVSEAPLSSSLIWLLAEALISIQAALLRIVQNRALEINYMGRTLDGSGVSLGSSEGYPLNWKLGEFN